jgi:hypothetical protein
MERQISRVRNRMGELYNKRQGAHIPPKDGDMVFSKSAKAALNGRE